MTVTQPETSQNIVALYRSVLADVSNATTALNLGRAIDAFERFLGQEDEVPPGAVSEALLSRWVAWMVQQGFSFSTLQTYVSKISSLHGRAVRAGSLGATDAFAQTSARLRAIPQQRLRVHAAAQDVVECLRKLTAPELRCSPQLLLARDVLMTALYLGGIDPESVARLRCDDCPEADSAIAALAERRQRSRGQYLFALRQATRSVHSLRQAVKALWGDALAAAGLNLDLAADNDALAADLWAECALRAGFAPAAIAGALRQAGADSPLMALGETDAITADQARTMRGRVNAMLQSDPEQWHALQMRPRVNYSTLRSRMDATGASAALSTVFYPMEEIVRRTGRRTTAKSRPIVPGLLFFRCRTSHLGPLFRNIGDLAWGYRTRRGPGAPYAVISPEAMQLFQITIGRFDSDTEVLPAGTITPQPGDRIEIIGGDFIGRTATFAEDVAKGGRTIYRLKLMGDNAIEWTFDADPRLTRPLTTT